MAPSRVNSNPPTTSDKASHRKPRSSSPPQVKTTSSRHADSASMNEASKNGTGVSCCRHLKRGDGRLASDGKSEGKRKSNRSGANSQKQKMTVYLPKEVRGATVLIKEGGNSWRATNALLHAETRGLGYRRSKNINDHLSVAQRLAWGDVMTGIDEGDGWIRCRVPVETGESCTSSTSVSCVHSSAASAACSRVPSPPGSRLPSPPMSAAASRAPSPPASVPASRAPSPIRARSSPKAAGGGAAAAMTNVLRSISHSPSREMRTTKALSCQQSRNELPSTSVLLQSPGVEADAAVSSLAVEDADAHSSETSFLSARSFIFDSDGKCQALFPGNGVGDGGHQGRSHAQLEGFRSHEEGCLQKTVSTERVRAAVGDVIEAQLSALLKAYPPSLMGLNASVRGGPTGGSQQGKANMAAMPTLTHSMSVPVMPGTAVPCILRRGPLRNASPTVSHASASSPTIEGVESAGSCVSSAAQLGASQPQSFRVPLVNAQSVDVTASSAANPCTAPLRSPSGTAREIAASSAGSVRGRMVAPATPLHATRSSQLVSGATAHAKPRVVVQPGVIPATSLHATQNSQSVSGATADATARGIMQPGGMRTGPARRPRNSLPAESREVAFPDMLPRTFMLLSARA